MDHVLSISFAVLRKKELLGHRKSTLTTSWFDILATLESRGQRKRTTSFSKQAAGHTGSDDFGREENWNGSGV